MRVIPNEGPPEPPITIEFTHKEAEALHCVVGLMLDWTTTGEHEDFFHKLACALPARAGHPFRAFPQYCSRCSKK